MSSNQYRGKQTFSWEVVGPRYYGFMVFMHFGLVLMPCVCTACIYRGRALFKNYTTVSVSVILVL